MSKLAVVGALVLVALVVTATPASAHADLVASEPPTGTVLAEAPRSVRLVFTEPVDPTFTRVVIRGTGGLELQPVSVTSDEARSVVVALPALGDGAYAVTWTSTTTDGHTAAGDVLLGVGHAADLVPRSPAEPAGEASWLRRGALVGRVAWYVGLALLVGALVWRPGGSRAVVAGWWILLVATLVRIGILVASLRSAADGASVGDVIARLRPTVPGKAWFVIFDVMVLCAVFLRRRTRRALLGACAVLVIAEACTGHASVGEYPAVTVAATSVHLGALALWLGGLFVLVRTPTLEQARAFLRRFSPVALGAFAAVIASGSVMSWVHVGGWRALTDSSYGHTLAVKLALVVTVAGFGAWHWRTGARRMLRFTLRAEVALAVGVVVLASVLAASVPGRAVVARPSFAAASNPTSAKHCADALIETASCWEQYFAYATMRHGPADALAEIEALARDNNIVESECHQLTHTVGRTAFETIGSAPKALASSEPLCNSGYPHGVIEEAIARLSPDELRQELPTFCEPVTYRRYSFDHHNCAHGVGHGIATRLRLDVFASTPYCEVMRDEWEVQSCYGGVFMQKVIGDINGASVDERPENPVWPCDAVPEVQKDACYRIATGRVLRLVDYDWKRTFAICDAVEVDHVDACYESIGRDAAGFTLFEPARMRELCLQAGNLGPMPCIVGAVQTTVDNEHGGKAAAKLCALFNAELRERCRAVRAEALAQF